jgi:hypothetical protein
MMWREMTVIVVVLAASPSLAALPFAAAEQPDRLCRSAISASERAHNIPPHVLAAIGRIESGRKDIMTDTVNPWPWAVNAEGQGYFYDSKAQAVAAVLGMQKQGMRSIDVGCMQISLLYHPDAFSSLEQAFDPAVNADYGGRFLAQLHDQANSWPRAVEMYHSATPDIGEEYGRRVYAALPEEQRRTGQDLSTGLIPSAGLFPTGGRVAALASLSAPVIRSPFSPIFRPSPGRVIALPSTAQMGAAPGRDLAAYRAAPIQLAFRGP